MNLDAFQLAIVAAVARENGDLAEAARFDKMLDRQLRAEVAEKREFRRRLEARG